MNLDQQLLRQLQSGAELPAAINSTALARALQTRLERIDVTSPAIEVSFVAGEDFTQAEDVVNGGIVATMLDFAMAYVALLAIPDGQSVATISMTLSCIRSARAGRFRATGEIERCGRTVVFTRARLVDDENRVIATAVSSLAIVAPRRNGAA